MEPDLYTAALHEEVRAIQGVFALRVPGGWIYTFNGEDGMSSCFVPYNEEFKASLQ